MKAVLAALAANEKAASLLVAAVVVTVTMVWALQSPSSSVASIGNPPVSVVFGKGSISVRVELPRGGTPYSYYSYYNYYSYYGYYGYSTQAPIPVRVIVAVETAGTAAPKLVAADSVIRYAYSSDNVATFTFKVAPGQYRVKVMFWNEHLPVLLGKNEAWKSLAEPYSETGVVS